MMNSIFVEEMFYKLDQKHTNFIESFYITLTSAMFQRYFYPKDISRVRESKHYMTGVKLHSFLTSTLNKCIYSGLVSAPLLPERNFR
jgi:hypothetical protein